MHDLFFGFPEFKQCLRFESFFWFFCDSFAYPVSVRRDKMGLYPFVFLMFLVEDLWLLSTTLISRGRDMSFIAYANDKILLSRTINGNDRGISFLVSDSVFI